MPRAKANDSPPDPDKLIRREAGRYATADERFEVREADVGWFVVDTTQTNEFGQELIRGPYATLKAARAGIPAARDTKQLARPRAAERPDEADKRQEAPKPKPKPPSWIDRLAPAEGRRVRLLIRALEGEGISDAESLVRRDREGLFAAVATRLIERRLEAVADEVPPRERKRARQLVQRVAEILTAEGTTLPDPLPGWSLVEIGPEPQPENRRINLEE